MEEDVLSAASELRDAIHNLAQMTREVELGSEQLLAAKLLVETASEKLQGEPLLHWSEKPEGSRKQTSKSYRSRSLFQGELHPFSPPVHWDLHSGPDGQPGYLFETTLSSLYEGAIIPSETHFLISFASDISTCALTEIKSPKDDLGSQSRAFK